MRPLTPFEDAGFSFFVALVTTSMADSREGPFSLHGEADLFVHHERGTHEQVLSGRPILSHPVARVEAAPILEPLNGEH